MRSRRFLVVEHEDECPPEWFGQWWGEAGIALERVLAHRVGAGGIPRRADADALVVLGGEAGANDDDAYPWLPATRQLIETSVAEGLPFLGICLGHQLATVALGGRVGANPKGPATGLTRVTLTAAGRHDSLVRDLDGALAVQWNDDVALELPSAARLLASAPDGTPQIVRFGSRAWGVQFHPEISPRVFDSWTIAKPSSGEPRREGRDPGAASRAIHQAEAELRHTWKPLARRFADLAR